MNEVETTKAYRQKKFAVEVTPARHAEFEGEITLSITHNGYQWQSMELTPDEVVKVVQALQTVHVMPLTADAGAAAADTGDCSALSAGEREEWLHTNLYEFREVNRRIYEVVGMQKNGMIILCRGGNRILVPADKAHELPVSETAQPKD